MKGSGSGSARRWCAIGESAVAVALVVLLVALALPSPAAGQSSNSRIVEDGVTEHRGDIVRFTIRLNVGSATNVKIGSDTTPYQARFRVRDTNDDARVTVSIDTTAVDTSPTGGLGVEPGDSLEDVTVTRRPSGPLPAETYLVQTVEEPRFTDQMVVDVRQPSMGKPSAGRAPAATRRALDAVDAAARRGTVARGDWALVRFNASGLEGSLNPDALDGSPSSNGITVWLNESGAGTVRARHPGDVGAVNVVPRLDEDHLWLAWDTSGMEDLGVAERSVRVTLQVDASELRAWEGSASRSVGFTVAEPELFLIDGEPWEVRPEPNRTLRARTNLAPGTEVTIDVVRVEDEFTLDSRTLVVPQSGKLTPSFDLSQVRDRTELRIGAASFPDDPARGVVRDPSVTPPPTTRPPTATPTPTPTTQTTTQTPAPTTPPDGDEAEETTTTSPSSTGGPGFGIVSLLVALTGTILAARRRR